MKMKNDMKKTRKKENENEHEIWKQKKRKNMKKQRKHKWKKTGKTKRVREETPFDNFLRSIFHMDPMLGLFADICGKPCFLTSVGIIWRP